MIAAKPKCTILWMLQTVNIIVSILLETEKGHLRQSVESRLIRAGRPEQDQEQGVEIHYVSYSVHQGMGATTSALTGSKLWTRASVLPCWPQCVTGCGVCMSSSVWSRAWGAGPGLGRPPHWSQQGGSRTWDRANNEGRPFGL